MKAVSRTNQFKKDYKLALKRDKKIQKPFTKLCLNVSLVTSWCSLCVLVAWWLAFSVAALPRCVHLWFHSLRRAINGSTLVAFHPGPSAAIKVIADKNSAASESTSGSFNETPTSKY